MSVNNPVPEPFDGTILLVAGAAPFSTRDVWQGYVEGLREIGVSVLPYPMFSMLSVLSAEVATNDVLGKSVDVRNGVKAVVFVDGLFFRGERRWVIESLSRLGLITALVATEDPYSPLEDEDDVYSLRFTNELQCVSERVSYLPVATPQPPDLDEVPFVRDLVFVGTLFEDRWKTMLQIAHECQRLKLRFDIFGHFLADPSELRELDCVRVYPRTLSAEEKWYEYGRSKMVLNVFRDEGRPGGAVSANPRIYEVMALGTPALITNARREVVERFGDSLYVFEDAADFARQATMALEDEAGRKARVSRAEQVAQNEHRYAHRASVLVSALSHELNRAERSSGR